MCHFVTLSVDIIIWNLMYLKVIYHVINVFKPIQNLCSRLSCYVQCVLDTFPLVAENVRSNTFRFINSLFKWGESSKLQLKLFLICAGKIKKNELLTIFSAKKLMCKICWYKCEKIDAHQPPSFRKVLKIQKKYFQK